MLLDPYCMLEIEGLFRHGEGREQDGESGRGSTAQTTHHAGNWWRRLRRVHRAVRLHVGNVAGAVCRVVHRLMHRAQPVCTMAIVARAGLGRPLRTTPGRYEGRQHRCLAREPDQHEGTKVMSDCRHGTKVRQVYRYPCVSQGAPERPGSLWRRPAANGQVTAANGRASPPVHDRSLALPAMGR